MLGNEKTFGDVIASILFKAASESVNRNAERFFVNMKKKMMALVCGTALVGIGLLLFLAGVVAYVSTLIGIPYALLLVGAVMSIIGAILLR